RSGQRWPATGEARAASRLNESILCLLEGVVTIPDVGRSPDRAKRARAGRFDHCRFHRHQRGFEKDVEKNRQSLEGFRKQERNFSSLLRTSFLSRFRGPLEEGCRRP